MGLILYLREFYLLTFSYIYVGKPRKNIGEYKYSLIYKLFDQKGIYYFNNFVINSILQS